MATADRTVPRLVVDPACGGGAFLLAALDRLVELGLDPVDALERVAGLDLDPDAAEASRRSVELWALAAGTVPGRIDVGVGDALAAVPRRWNGGVLVVGNPPFATPLKAGAMPEEADRFRARRSDLLGPYADLATIHLLRTVEWAGSGSTVAMVQPQSTLASRDTVDLRGHLDRVAPLRAVWAAREPLFDASVRTWAPVLAVGGPPSPSVELATGPDVVAIARVGGDGVATGSATAGVAGSPGGEIDGYGGGGGRWAQMAADALGAPSLPPMTTAARPDELRRLGDLATASAGFRDEHYGLAAACREALDDELLGPSGPLLAAAGREAGAVGGSALDGLPVARVVTVGSIDPLELAWGRRPIRFGGRRWDRPVVDRARLDPKVGRWFDRNLGPKVLLATQTKLLEPVVDWNGDLMPATPVIAVAAPADRLAHVAAVLLAPPVSAWAWRRWFGTALTVDAIKLAARQVIELPLPPGGGLWDEAAALVAETRGGDPDGIRSTVQEVAAIMTAAYGASDEVLTWWQRRWGGEPSATV